MRPNSRCFVGDAPVREKRKKIWIDRFQFYLAARLATYFVLYQVALWALYFIDARLNALGESVGQTAAAYGFYLTPVMTLGLGLLFIYDTARLTHRVVGPLYRFRKTIQAVTAGGEVPIVGLRDGDYLLEMRDDFNEMLRALEARGAITIKEPAGARQPVAV
jgi:hypothetical protein